MNRLIRKTFIFTAVAAMALQPVLAQAQVAVGSANKVVASVQGVLQTNTRTLVVKDEVFSNEVVNTDADSAARFVFRDSTMLSVGANSSVTLDKFIFDPDASKSEVAVSMSKGVMRFVSGNLAKDRYSIRTPTAIIGIRGTILVVAVAANGATSLSVIEGVATMTAAGATTTVSSGFTSTVSAGAPPTPPTASPPPSPQVQAMNSSLGPEPGTTSAEAGAQGAGGLSAGAITGAVVAAAALAVAISAAGSDSDSISTTDASSSTATATSGE